MARLDNDTLARLAPAASACLSPLGREIRFPKGILSQNAQSRGAELRATIGQLTDGEGHSLGLTSITRHLEGLNADQVCLYSPPGGFPALRRAWADRQGLPDQDDAPVVTLGLTHGLSTLADLFCDADTDVIVPLPYWGNYRLIFEFRRGARLVTYPFFDGDGFNVAGLRDALSKVRAKALVILNFPGNPTGYTPHATDEVPAILNALTSCPKPIVVATDDAYEDWVFEPDAQPRSLFWALRERVDPARVLPVKVDGATKSLLFFGGRVGFLRFGCDPEAGAVLADKAMAIARGTVSTPPGPSQALTLAALQDPRTDVELAARKDLMLARYQALTQSLPLLEGTRLSPLPGNAGFFRLLQCTGGLDAETVRLDLLREHSAGVIAISSTNALRVAFCSIEAHDIPKLVSRLRAVAG